jgi:hypothetical protein
MVTANGAVIRVTARGGAGRESNAPAGTEMQAGDAVPEWARRDSNARPLAPEPPEASDGERPSA